MSNNRSKLDDAAVVATIAKLAHDVASDPHVSGKKEANLSRRLLDAFVFLFVGIIGGAILSIMVGGWLTENVGLLIGLVGGFFLYALILAAVMVILTPKEYFPKPVVDEDE